MRATESAITAEGVRKKYAGGADGAGLNGFDLRVPTGTVCGLLGPNGAGKTTAVRILSTLLDLDSGHASVAGFDVRTQPRRVREHIGLVGQYAAVDEILTGRQNLVMFGRLNHLSSTAAGRRADELLERFSLTETGRKPVGKYSGGMRRRLDLATSLIVTPPVLFVDEPTTGLDPAARREVWTAIRDLVDSGTTVLLTTQYLEEADRLADRISMLRAGRVVTEGTPEELKSAIGGDWLDIVLSEPADVAATAAIAARVASGEIHVDGGTRRVSVPVDLRTRALVEVATALGDAGIEPADITLRRPTLDEVFLQLTSDPPATPAGGAPLAAHQSTTIGSATSTEASRAVAGGDARRAATTTGSTTTTEASA
ncbi:ATP-binding cassette domain-containing protein [Streptosporangium roseum]|uniref:ATP-binding cassette domain-containing protein n=1 Tax=Streptosporangium roseum TaxID=2001 RepID=UPI003316B745